jgi:hypothetical protein
MLPGARLATKFGKQWASLHGPISGDGKGSAKW